MKFAEGIVKEINIPKKTITAVASSLSVDREGEIIIPRSMSKRIGNYKSNPVLLFGHPLKRTKTGVADPMDLIGKTTDIQISDKEVTTVFEYAVDLNPRAKFIFDMAQADFYRAYSVGGWPHESVTMSDPSAHIERALGQFGAAGSWCLEQMKTDAANLTVTDFELWEISQVFVGSNRPSLKKALEKAISGGLVSQKDVSAMLRGEVPERIKRVSVGIDLKKDNLKGLLEIPGCDKEAGEKFLESLDEKACSEYYYYRPAYHPVVADVKSRLDAQSCILAQLVDPDGDGDIDSTTAIASCVQVLLSVIDSLNALRPTEELAEETTTIEAAAIPPKEEEDDEKTAIARDLMAKQLADMKSWFAN